MHACIFTLAEVKEFPMMQQEQFDLFGLRDRQLMDSHSVMEMAKRSKPVAFRDQLARLMVKYDFSQIKLAGRIEEDATKWPAMQGTISNVLAGKRGVPLNNLNAWVDAMPLTATEKAILYSQALREWAPDYVHEILDDLDTTRDTLRGVLVWLGTVVGVDFFDYHSPEVQKRVESFLTEMSKGRFPPSVIKQLRNGFVEMIIKSGISKEDYKP